MTGSNRLVADPSLMTSDTEAALRKAFTSWKLDLLNAMARDRMVAAVDFRIAFAIAQHMNARTKLAYVSDATLARSVNRNRAALTQFRKRMEKLGWLKVRRG